MKYSHDKFCGIEKLENSRECCVIDFKNFDTDLAEHFVYMRKIARSHAFSSACNRVESACACKTMRTDGAA